MASTKEFKAPVTKRKQKEDEDFPRGGATGLTPLEFKEVARQADSSLFSEPGVKAPEDGPVQKKRKVPKNKHANMDTNFDNSIEDKKARVEMLTFKNLTEGTKLLGCISGIGMRRENRLPELTVSLPNNLVGYINISEISDELLEAAGDELPDLNSLFHVGQWVQCAISNLNQGASGAAAASGNDKKRRKVQLTMKPLIVNAGLASIDIAPGVLVSGAIKSVEDHGYIVSLGMSGIHGFLKNSEAKMYQRIKNNEQPLSVGQVLVFNVVSVDGSRKTAQLTVDPLKTSKALLGDKFTFSEVGSIMPGCVVEAHVIGHRDIGVLCKFMGHFDASMDFFHTSEGIIESKKQLEKAFKLNSLVRARVLYVDLASTPAKIGLSTSQHVMALTQPKALDDKDSKSEALYPTSAVSVGHVFEEVTVKRVDAKVGLLCEIKSVNIPGYVHISRVTDEHLLALSASEGRFREGSTHRAIVLGYDPVDGVFQLSFQKSVIEQPFLRAKDVEVGEIIKGTVAKVMDKGLAISLAKNISAFVPLVHCVDSAVTSSTKKHVDEKFKVGKQIKCRVLANDDGTGKILLTCKDSLIKSKFPVWSNLELLEEGMLSDGVIQKVLPKGCIVSFYGDVKGFVHISELSETFVTDINVFQPGQVKTCRILEIDAAEKNLKLSFKKSSVSDLSSAPVGSLQKGKVQTIKEDIVHITLKPSEVRAILPVDHLSDHLGEHNQRIYSGLKEGMVLSDLLVISQDEGRGHVRVSKKPALVYAAKEKSFITKRADLQEGKLYAAFVRQVPTFGVFVEFGNRLEAFAHKSRLANRAGMKFVKNQSVIVKVIKNDLEAGKTEVTLKPSDLATSSDYSRYQGEFMQEYFKQLERLAKKSDSKASVGACTMVEVKQVKDSAWTVAYSDIDGQSKTVEVPVEQTTGLKGKKGLKCPAKILDIDFAKSHVDFTLKSELISESDEKAASEGKFSLADQRKDLEQLRNLQKERDVVETVVEVVAEDYLVVSIPSANNALAVVATKSLNDRGERFISHKLGERIKAEVIYVPKKQGSGQTAERVVVSMEHLPSPKSAEEGKKKPKDAVAENGINTFEDVVEGQVVIGRITGVSETSINVFLGDKVFGRISLTNIADTYAPADEMLKAFKKWQEIKVYVLHIDQSNRRIDLSLRPSRITPGAHKPVHDPEVKSYSDVVPGGILQGFISNVADKGVFVALNHKITGRVKIAEMSDDYLKDWKAHFRVGQLVKAKVVAVNEERNTTELTLKASQVDPSIKPILTLADFEKGQKVKGTIKAVKDIGVFIKIDNSTVSGLCHISEISENRVPDVSKLYAEGDPVKAKILDINMEKKRISFGLKSSYFEEGDADEGSEDEDAEMEGAEDEDVEMSENGVDDDDEDEEEDDEDDEEEEEDDEDDEEEEEDDGEVDVIFAGHSDDSEGEVDEDEENEAEGEDSDVEMTEEAPLSVGSGFNWDGKDDMADQEAKGNLDSDSDSDDEASTKKKKKSKKQGEVKDDTEDLQSQAPQVATDYERLLLGSPNSSYLWINYMAFQLQLSEIEKAREIGQRALKTISFREEQEKMNVWVALMNLENTFGSADSLEEVFKKALQMCEPKKVYIQLVKIYERSNKIDLATELYQTMTKKFGQSSKVWTGFGHFQLHHGNLDAGRELLQRSLKSLPKRKHIKTVTKFAQLEFKYGEPERGRTIFEGVMSNYPKRVDLWSVYIDMEIRNGEQDAVRRLFARVVSLKLSSKKMKFFFKKWLSYEKDHGDEEHIDEVKQRALAYVESLSA